MSEIARETGLSRESLYKSLSGERSPSFETASASLRWITERMFVGTGARHPDQVVMRFWQLA